MKETVNLRQVQLAETDILREAVKLCERHGLRYAMIGGTMLGAVRHRGFIPWDDDIDIALPREDYERFLQYAREELPSPYQLLTHNGKHPCMYAKIHNTDTTFIEASVVGHKEYYKGVFIDVMPLDGLPENEKKRRRHQRRIGALVKAFTWHRFGFGGCKTWKAKLCYLIPEKWIFKRWDRLCKRYEFDSSTYTSYTWTYRCKRFTFLTEHFRETADYAFEYLTVKGAKDFDRYLTTHFGDSYMQLPPEEARQSHSSDGGVIDLEQSYLAYGELKEV